MWPPKETPQPDCQGTLLRHRPTVTTEPLGKEGINGSFWRYSPSRRVDWGEMGPYSYRFRPPVPSYFLVLHEPYVIRESPIGDPPLVSKRLRDNTRPVPSGNVGGVLGVIRPKCLYTLLSLGSYHPSRRTSTSFSFSVSLPFPCPLPRRQTPRSVWSEGASSLHVLPFPQLRRFLLPFVTGDTLPPVRLLRLRTHFS